MDDAPVIEQTEDVEINLRPGDVSVCLGVVDSINSYFDGEDYGAEERLSFLCLLGSVIRTEEAKITSGGLNRFMDLREFLQ